MLRVSKYLPGGSFRPHTDTTYAESQFSVGFDTILVYLNEDMEGGHTELLTPEGSWVSVQPKPGRALVFHHMTLHAGEEVTKGLKYVVRTEVVYGVSTSAQ